MIATLTLPSFRKLAAAAALALTISAGCTYDHGKPTVVVPCENATAQLATYRGVVSPIFDQHCRSCHGATYAATGNGIPFRNHQDIKDYNSESILCSIKHTGCREMPQGGDKLSNCDIARLEAWFNAGTLNN